MSARYTAKPENDEFWNREVFFVYSWKDEEYLQAISNQEFFENVKGMLDAEPSADLNHQDMARSKLYFAGGPARWMFQYLTSEFICLTFDSINQVNDIMPYITGGRRDPFDKAVDHLFSACPTSEYHALSIVSRFASVQLAIKDGPDLVLKLANATRHDNNPMMEALLLEMWFFASLYNGGLELMGRYDRVTVTWLQSSMQTLSDISLLCILPDDVGVWFKLKSFNEGGCDSVFVDRSQGLVRLVQITRCYREAFKPDRGTQSVLQMNGKITNLLFT